MTPNTPDPAALTEVLCAGVTPSSSVHGDRAANTVTITTTIHCATLAEAEDLGDAVWTRTQDLEAASYGWS